MVSKQSNAQWTGKSCSLRSSGELTATVLGAEMDRVFSSSAIPVCRGEVESGSKRHASSGGAGRQTATDLSYTVCFALQWFSFMTILINSMD